MPNTVCSSPIEVLRKYRAKLLELMEPSTAAIHLFSKRLISDRLHEDLITRRDLSRFDKASLIMNELIHHTMPGGDVMYKIKTLCAILKTDSTDVMKEVVLKLEREVGVSQRDD